MKDERIEHVITNADCYHERICGGGRRDIGVGRK